MNCGFMMVTIPRDDKKTPTWTEVKKEGDTWKPVPAHETKFVPTHDKELKK